MDFECLGCTQLISAGVAGVPSACCRAGSEGKRRRGAWRSARPSPASPPGFHPRALGCLCRTPSDTPPATPILTPLIQGKFRSLVLGRIESASDRVSAFFSMTLFRDLQNLYLLFLLHQVFLGRIPNFCTAPSGRLSLLFRGRCVFGPGCGAPTQYFRVSWTRLQLLHLWNPTDSNSES